MGMIIIIKCTHISFVMYQLIKNSNVYVYVLSLGTCKFYVTNVGDENTESHFYTIIPFNVGKHFIYFFFTEIWSVIIPF